MVNYVPDTIKLIQKLSGVLSKIDKQTTGNKSTQKSSDDREQPEKFYPQLSENSTSKDKQILQNPKLLILICERARACFICSWICLQFEYNPVPLVRKGQPIYISSFPCKITKFRCNDTRKSLMSGEGASPLHLPSLLLRASQLCLCINDWMSWFAQKFFFKTLNHTCVKIFQQKNNIRIQYISNVPFFRFVCLSS